MNLSVRCALVGLWMGLSTVSALAKDAASMCRCQGDRGPNFDRIQRVLGEPLKATGLDFTEEPLENVVNFLQDEYEIPIQLDEPALEDAGLTRDEHMTDRIQNVSLRSALRLMLKTKQLTYLIQDETLVITTPEEAETQLVACVYDVRDIIGKNRGNKELIALVGTIQSCVDSGNWAVDGHGNAEVKPLQPGLLVISQTQAVHEEIGDLLTLIRETLQRPPIEATRGFPGMGRGGRGMEMGGGYGMGMGGRGGEGGFGMEGRPGFGGMGGRGGDGGRGGGRGMDGGRGGDGARGGYGSEMGRGREPEPTPATDDLFGP
jgi:hypothetical protein